MDIDLSAYIEQDKALWDDNGNVVEEPVEEPGTDAEQGAEGDAESADTTAEAKTDANTAEKPPDETKPAVQITDDTEVDVDGEKVKLADMRSAYNEIREARRDYTQKTQALADDRRAFQAQAEAVRSETERLFKDAGYLVSRLKRIAPKTLHDAMVKYGTEYSELLELRDTDPAAYRERLRVELEENNRLDAQERQEAEDRKKKHDDYQREVARIRGIIDTHRDKSLETVGVLPKGASKDYNEYIQNRFREAYIVFVNSHPGIEITQEVISDVAKSLSKDEGIKAKLELDKIKASTVKETPKINKVEGNESNRKRNAKPKTDDKITHENFFDRIAVNSMWK